MTLEELRAEIDILDRQLVQLLNQRAGCARMIGRIKAANSMPVYEPGREQIVHENLRRANPGPLRDDDLLNIFERIIDVMRTLQRRESAALKTALGHDAAGPAPGVKP
jgi:chorismate mutase